MRTARQRQVKGFSYRGSTLGVRGLSPAPRTSCRSGHPAPLFVPGFLGPGPSDTGEDAVRAAGTVAGGARRRRPCPEAGGPERRGGPLPREPRQVPAGVQRLAIVFGEHRNPCYDLRASRFPPGGQSVSFEALFRVPGPGLR